MERTITIKLPEEMASANESRFEIYAGHDPRELPTYNIVEAAHYLRMPLPTLRSWVRGRYYLSNGIKKFFTPVIQLPDKTLPLLSFMNLIEAHVLDAIRHQHKVPLPKVRRAINYLKKVSPSGHPLAEKWFQTDGVDLFVEEYGRLINVSRDGQLEMKEIIAAYLHRVDRDPSGVAARLYPFIKKRHPEAAAEEPRLVVIDPLISFGRPVLAGTGIPTAIIAERYQAGDAMDELAEDYGLERSTIEEAVRYEFAQNRAA